MEDKGKGPADRPSLRERKKEKTRRLIQETAIRLFSERGYETTSVEQIAEAAEVSPSTVFRYFPTKPDLVTYDDFDEDIVELFRSQPSDLSAVAAIRRALREALTEALREDALFQRERERLIRTVPELRAATVDEFATAINRLAGMIAERTGREAADVEVLGLAGAVTGVIIAAWFAGGDWTEHLTERVDDGLALLESGFSL